MSIFSISDLHLPLGVDKPMDVFGQRWEGYVKRLEENWRELVGEGDTVLIPGDISWATYPEQARVDLEFIESLPGKKIISKGNHDYWWQTLNKLGVLCKEWGFCSMTFLHNTAHEAENCAVAAARGWLTPEDKAFTKEDEKIYNREQIRLALSLEAAKRLSKEKLILMIHYPPLGKFYEIIQEFGVDAVVYGHLHANSAKNHKQIGENFLLCSSDYLEFCPKKLNL